MGIRNSFGIKRIGIRYVAVPLGLMAALPLAARAQETLDNLIRNISPQHIGGQQLYEHHGNPGLVEQCENILLPEGYTIEKCTISLYEEKKGSAKEGNNSVGPAEKLGSAEKNGMTEKKDAAEKEPADEYRPVAGFLPAKPVKQHRVKRNKNKTGGDAGRDEIRDEIIPDALSINTLSTSAGASSSSFNKAVDDSLNETVEQAGKHRPITLRAGYTCFDYRESEGHNGQYSELNGCIPGFNLGINLSPLFLSLDYSDGVFAGVHKNFGIGDTLPADFKENFGYGSSFADLNLKYSLPLSEALSLNGGLGAIAWMGNAGAETRILPYGVIEGELDFSLGKDVDGKLSLGFLKSFNGQYSLTDNVLGGVTLPLEGSGIEIECSLTYGRFGIVYTLRDISLSGSGCYHTDLGSGAGTALCEPPGKLNTESIKFEYVLSHD